MTRSLALLVLSACGPAEATLTEVESEVFGKSCVFSACHVGPAPPMGLVLVAPAHSRLVGVASMEKPGAMLIAPGDQGASFLLDKVLDRSLPTAPQGDQPWTVMPPGARLEEDRIELVRRWIEAGALDD